MILFLGVADLISRFWMIRAALFEEKFVIENRYCF